MLEPSSAGALKTERKGVALYELEVIGRAAHAGLDPGQGANAAVELAHQLLAVAALARPELGTTVTPTLVSAGTAANTVPAKASVHVDVRARTSAEAERVASGFAGLRPVTPHTSLSVERSVEIPPLERRASAALFGRAQALAAGLGLPPLEEASVGGGSDGSVLAGLGVAVLDGLGAVGDHAHAEGEYVEVGALAERAALVAALVQDLLAMTVVARTDRRRAGLAFATMRAASVSRDACDAVSRRRAHRRPDRARRSRASRALAGRDTVRLRPPRARRRGGPHAALDLGRRRATARPAGSRAGRRTRRPPGRRTAPQVAFLRAADGPPQVWLLPAAGGEPEQLTTLPLGAGAPVWSADGSRIAFGAANRPGPRRRTADRHRPSRLPGRRRGLPAHDPQAPLRARPGGEGVPAGHPRRLARGRPGMVARRWEARVRGCDGSRRRPALPRAPLHPRRELAPPPSPSSPALPTGSAAPSPGAPDGSALIAVGLERAARRPCRSAARPARRRCRRPGRAARPQRDAGRPGLPGRTAAVRRRRRDRLLRARPRLHARLRGRGGRRHAQARSSAAPRAASAALSVVGGTAAVVLATATSFGEVVTVDVATGGETVRTEHGKSCGGARALRARGARVHDLGRHRRARLADPQARRAVALAAPARHPRRPAQRLERRRRRLAPLPPGARGPRLDRAAAQPARQRRVRRRLLQRRDRRLGRGRREGLPRAARPARRRGRRRSEPARGHGLQLRRLHDVLPDEPRRPLRGRGRRRGGQRSRQHVRHVGLGSLPLRARARGAVVGRARALRRDVAARPGRRGAYADADLPRRRRRPLPRRPGAAVARRAPGARRPDAGSCSIPTPRTCSCSMDGRRTGSISATAWSTGSSSTPATDGRRSTRNTGSSASPSWPSATACPAPRSGSCACGRAGRTTSSRSRQAS